MTFKESQVFAPNWPTSLQTGVRYEVACDDDGHLCDAEMHVIISDCGDVFVGMHAYQSGTDMANPTVDDLNPFPTIRIRTHGGGGRNHRTHQALLWLAKAIKLDSLEINKNNE